MKEDEYLKARNSRWLLLANANDEVFLWLLATAAIFVTAIG